MISAPDTLPLPPAWRPLTAAQAQELRARLQGALTAEHLLYGVPVHAVAEAATHEVLFRHCNDPVRFTVVRLALSPGSEPNTPSVLLDGSWLDFVAGQGAPH